MNSNLVLSRLQITKENQEYLSVKEYLQKELSNVEKGKAEYITINEFDKDLQSTIDKYEA